MNAGLRMSTRATVYDFESTAWSTREAAADPTGALYGVGSELYTETVSSPRKESGEEDSKGSDTSPGAALASDMTNDFVL